MFRSALLSVSAFIIGLSTFHATAHQAVAPELMEDTPYIQRDWNDDPGKFNFAIIGDRTGGTPEEWPVFDRAIDEINLLRPDFAIMVGDMIYGNEANEGKIEEQWEEFMSHAKRIEVPLMVLPGNHDIDNKMMEDFWIENLGRTWYSFDYMDCHFVLLNTVACYDTVGCSLGEEQMAWVLDDLAAHADAKHTFVFMHIPIWFEDSSHEWNQIEQALSDRPYSVIAGHYHRLVYDDQRPDDQRYIVVGATKGEVVRGPNPTPELGEAPHYSWVTVENGEPTIGMIEPGSIWPEDISRRTFHAALRGFLTDETLSPTGIGTKDGRAGFRFDVTNKLPGDVKVRIELSGTDENGWQPVDGKAEHELVIAPGEAVDKEIWFDVDPDGIIPVPRVRYTAYYNDRPVARYDHNIHLYPEDELKVQPTWMTVGAWDAGDLPSSMPKNPKERIPLAFVDHGPEQGYDPDKTYETMTGEQKGWVEIEQLPNMPGFIFLRQVHGIPFGDLGYASCGVYSPKKQTVYARFRVDDYGQIFVNGSQIGDPLYRTRRDPTWVALPLKKGWNEVVIKNIAISGGWGFWLLFADPTDELELAPTLPEKAAAGN